MGALLAWLSDTRRVMAERVVSEPTRVARMCNAPEPLMVPPMTAEPTSFVTGIDSPEDDSPRSALMHSTSCAATIMFLKKMVP